MTYIKPDIIVAWPRNCDYPLWRLFIHENRHLFNEVIIVFTETNQGSNYRAFVREQMTPDYCLFVESQVVKGDEDWRDVAIKTAFNHSYNASWIWFTEQDFMITHPSLFWLAVEEGQEKADVIGVDDSGRLHPCCLFIKREALDRTKKYFGIQPDVYDHFGQIQKDLEASQSPKCILSEEYYFHYNGLSHNMTLAGRHEAPNYKPDEFKNYIVQCVEAENEGKIVLSSEWRDAFLWVLTA